MASPQLDDQVVLQHDIPELSLRSGDVGVVRGSVSEPTLAYEVEFRPGLGPTTLALLTAADLEVRPSTRGEKDQTNPGAPAPPAAEPAPGFVRCRRCGADTTNPTAGLCPSCLMIAAAAAMPGSSVTEPGGRSVEQQRLEALALWPGWERPEKIGPYRILETIGEGSMGIVYKAEQRQPVRRLVALKVVKLGMDTKEVIARFEAERQALAMMNHPNVARVYDAGVTDRGTPYFVMEYVPGEPITSYCDLHRMSLDQRLRLFTQACDAVQHAHHKAIIHRDIKPSNVLVTEQDGKLLVKVIDFGIAKALNQRLTDHTVYTEMGRLMGTPEYMSPEQAEQSAIDVDTRTDVYSLGVVLYELLGGALPFDSKMLRTGGHEGLRRIIGQQAPRKPSDWISTGDDNAKLSAQLRGSDCQSLSRALRRELEWIPLKAIRKDRAERYRSASQLADDVHNYLQGRPLIAGPLTNAYRARKFVRQHSTAVTIAGATLALIVALVIALAFTTRSAVRAWISEASHRRDADAARAIAEQRAREADIERGKAKAAAQLAELRLGDGLMSAGDSLTKSGQLGDARRCYLDALEIFRKLGTPPTAALAGVMNAGGDETPLMGAYGAKAGVGGFAGHTGNVTDVAFTRDGRHAITAGEDHALILWDVMTGAKIHEFSPRHTDGVTFVALSRDESTMLSASDDKTVIWWDLRTRSKILQLDGHTHQVWVVAFSPDGRYAASGGMDRSIRIWDLSTGKCIHILHGGPTVDDQPGDLRFDTSNPDGHTAAVAALVFLPDGKRLLSGSQDSTMKLWDIEHERLLATLRGHDDQVNCIALSPDGTHAVSASFDKALKLWDLTTQESIRKFEGHTAQVWRVAFSSDGQQIVSSGHDGIARIWDVNTGKELRALAAQTENVMAAAFSEDGNLVLSTRGPGSGNQWPHDEGTMALWDRAPDHGILGAAPLSSPVTSVSISDERLVLFGTADGTAALWDGTTRMKLRGFAAHRGGVRAVSLSRDGTLALTAGSDGVATLWDTATGRQVFRPFGGHAGPVTAAVMLSDGRYALTGGQDATLRMWDLHSGDQPRAFPPQTSAVTSISVSADGTRALTGGTDGTISLWTLATGEVRQLPGPKGAANCVAFSPVDETALSGGDDQLITLWDLKAGHAVRTFPKQNYRVTRIAFSPDGVTALSGTADGTVTLWDVKTATPLQSFTRHDDAITGLAFTTDGRCAVSASQDKTVRLWDFACALQYRQFEIRIPMARDLLAKSSNDAGALLAFGEWYAFRGKDNWAVEFLTHAREEGATVSPLTLARCYCRLNNAKAARLAFREAIKQELISEQYALLCLQAISPTTRPSQRSAPRR